MKLLFDQNLSPRLVSAVASTFPGSTHVRDAGLQSSDDIVVWHYAATYGYAIVSKDADFRQLSFALGPPPKVIWLRVGNCATRDILSVLLSHEAQISALEADPEAALLVIP